MMAEHPGVAGIADGDGGDARFPGDFRRPAEAQRDGRISEAEPAVDVKRGASGFGDFGFGEAVYLAAEGLVRINRQPVDPVGRNAVGVGPDQGGGGDGGVFRRRLRRRQHAGGEILKVAEAENRHRA